MSDPHSEADRHWRHTLTPPRSSVDEVHLKLRNMIHMGALGPGDRLPPERKLGELLQVSRSTLREGLRALRSDGYIEARRGSAGGNFISKLDEPYARWLQSMRDNPQLLRDIIDVRRAVECEIARLAAERRSSEVLDALLETVLKEPSAMTPRGFRDADTQFHSLLADASSNDKLKTLMTEARGALFSPANALLIDDATIQHSLADHRAILEAVRAGDRELAASLMRAHLDATFDLVSQAIDAPRSV